MKYGRYTFLDGLRGLAATFILTGHTYEYWHFNFFRAYLAVDLFFILSGFVIAYAYDESLRTGALSARGFLTVRLIRLYPVYLLSVALCTVTLIWEAIAKHNTGIDNLVDASFAIGMSLLFLPYHMAENVNLFPLNPPYWSLFFELFANAIYGFARRWLTTRKISVLIVLSGLGVIALAFVHGDLNAGFKWTVPHIGAGFLRSLFGIFVGLLLYRYHIRVQTLLENLSPWWAFAVVGIILASPSLGALDAPVDLLCVGVIFPLCVLVAARNSTTAPVLEGILLALGSASYPIYVLHVPVSKIVLYAWPGLDAYAPISGVVFVFGLIAASVWLEKFYDIPVRRRLSKRFR
jgi:peptidoglycan/LPS O-acetylase OafA/YrhL